MARDHLTKRSSAREYKDKKQIMYEENVKFCRAVQSQPCLYDRTQSQLPKDINGAWRAVAAICGDTALSCKLRWQNIRFAFMRSLQTSSNRLPNRLRKYYLHDVLEFVIPHIPTSYNSNTEDESKEVGENNTEESKQPEDMTPAKLDIDFDEERTTSANETDQEDQTPWTPTNTSSKKKENSVTLKENKVRKKENMKKITKAEVGMDNSDDDNDATWEENLGSTNEKEQVKSLRVKIEKIEAAKQSTPVEAEDVEANLRQFRFQRACKRSMDKSIVQQLSSPSPKNENESKRPRRSLSIRRATQQKSNQEAKESIDFTPPPTKLEKSAKEEEKKHKGRGRPRLRLAEETRPESEPMTAMSSFIPSDIVETELKTSSTSEEPAVVIEWAPPPPVIESVTIPITTQETLPKSSCVSFKLPASLLKIDRGTQCDSDFQRSGCDDEFLQLLRPQMAAMNARQRLHFKQKIYKSLIEVFDDPSNFPNSTDVPDASAFPVPPFPGVGPTTGAEMVLIRELVSLVQAAKLTPELMRNNGASQGNEGAKTQSSADVQNSTAATLSPSQVPQPNNSATQSKNSPPPLVKSNSNKIVFQTREQGMLDGGSQHSMLRKVVKVSGLVNNFREGGEKRRIFRILPKGVQPVRTPHSSTSSVGTFIIPRAPGSIASSVNAAAAAAAANSNTFMTGSNNLREIPVGGGKMLVSQAGSNGLNETALCTRRMMAVRNVRPSGGTSAPRQILRRYSICGTSGEGNKLLPMDNRRPGKLLTTTAMTSPAESQSLLLNSNNRPNNVRFVRATGTVTPPFKQPQAPMTVIPITQPHKTRTTLGSQRKILSDKQIDVSSSLHQSDVEMQTLPLTGFNSVFSSCSSMTSSTAITSTTMRGTKTPTKTATTSPPKSSVETNEKELSTLDTISTVGNEIMDNSAILPHDSKEDTAGIISSDFFDSFSIKSEPTDEMEPIE